MVILRHQPDFSGGCFRQREYKDGLIWCLDWLWIHPYARDRKVLTKHWLTFNSKFGDFFIEPPYSKAMQPFIEKHMKHSSRK